MNADKWFQLNRWDIAVYSVYIQSVFPRSGTVVNSLIKEFCFIRIPYPVQLPHLMQYRIPQQVNILLLDRGHKNSIAIRLIVPSIAEILEYFFLRAFFQPFI